MKRRGFLVDDIAEMKNLMLAFYKAAKGKNTASDVILYRQNLTGNLKRLQNQILEGKVDVGKYSYFKIYDPKERLICAAAFDERVLHHAIMNICHPIFERHLIYDTFATRIGKGTYKALERARENMTKYKYVAKLDVRKYFDSIPHDILLEKLNRLFKDKKLIRIFAQIINSYHSQKQDVLINEDHQIGIPIGNLTSQYFANYFLSETDHFIKEKLNVPFFVRYMDDMLLMENDRNVLKEKVRCVRKNLEDIGLQLKPEIIEKTAKGISFLGYKIYPQKILLNKRSKNRLKRKMKQYQGFFEDGFWSEKEYRDHIQPLLAFAMHAYTKRLRTEILEGSNRVLRGGSWNNNARNCRVANRNNNSPDNRNNNNGLRLALAQDDVLDDIFVNRESS